MNTLIDFLVTIVTRPYLSSRGRTTALRFAALAWLCLGTLCLAIPWTILVLFEVCRITWKEAR